MKKRIDEYDIKIINQIYELGDNPRFLRFEKNEIQSLWCRNKKDKISIGTYIVINGLEPNTITKPEEHGTNVYFEVTPKQAEEIIKELQKVLKNRKELRGNTKK